MGGTRIANLTPTWLEARRRLLRCAPLGRAASLSLPPQASHYRVGRHSITGAPAEGSFQPRGCCVEFRGAPGTLFMRPRDRQKQDTTPGWAAFHPGERIASTVRHAGPGYHASAFPFRHMRAANQPSLLKHGARSLWLALGWILVLLVIYLSLTPDPVTLPVREGDKFSHAFAYFVLMSWFANLYRSLRLRAGFAAGFIALGVALEFVQLWTGYRSFEVSDMVAGALGVAAGWAAAPPRLPNYLSLAERLWRTG